MASAGALRKIILAPVLLSERRRQELSKSTAPHTNVSISLFRHPVSSKSLIAAPGNGLPVLVSSELTAMESLASSCSERKRSILSVGGFLTPAVGLSFKKFRAIAKLNIVLNNVTHCAAAPLPPLGMLPAFRLGAFAD